MKGLIIVILLLLVLGLYFVPEFTKTTIKATGKATMILTNKAIDNLKDNPDVQETVDKVKKNITEKIKEGVFD